ncbi:hypothetical protein V495_03639 [Pseudogymnoascus sp. VKM F-4514 (FW-929)]|nr:hypothetical protein V495_03639 [Pseudogymnoascus sp. VKM F-4514 (FW-929)]KFY56736.1 hypothetical protein V497_06013 [Pseudogymnoascus sp. VKM F-4516 (FW-969)]
MYGRITFIAGLAVANAFIPDLHARQAGGSPGPSSSLAEQSGGSSAGGGSSGPESGSSSGALSSSEGGSSGGSGTITASLPIDTNFTPEPFSFNEEATINSEALASAASIAGTPASDIPGATIAAQPLVSPNPETTHGTFTGTATVTGAIAKGDLNGTIAALPPNPEATVYKPNGILNSNQTIPFQPAGGLGTNGTEPVYRVQSDFDYQSLLLGLYQEWIELDLFNDILNRFSEEDFAKLNLTASDRFLVEFMAEQENGHATLLSNLLGGPGGSTPQCSYNYPYKTLHEAFDFAQKLTRWGESGVWGFQAHLDSREAAQLLDQSIATEARQQMIFRQFSGLFPMPVWFETGIPQSWAWTLLAPYIASCPSNAKRLAWQNFPELHVLNQPNTALINASQGAGAPESGGNTTKTSSNETVGWGPAAPGSDAVAGNASCTQTNVTGDSCQGGISQNRSIPLSFPGRQVFLSWDAPGKPIGPNNSYVTSTLAKDPKFVVWVSQLNVTYSPLEDIKLVPNGTSSGSTIQPDVSTFEGDPAINGTMFIALTDTDEPFSMFNLSAINPHVVALALYQAG